MRSIRSPKTTPKASENKEWLERNQATIAAKRKEFIQNFRSVNA
jgi:hypothetical protein